MRHTSLPPTGALLVLLVSTSYGAIASPPPAKSAKSNARFLSLYERIAERGRNDPAYMKPKPKSPSDVNAVSWLAGHWSCDVIVFATPTTPERKGGAPEEQDFVLDANGDVFERKEEGGNAYRSPYLFFDPRAKLWVAPSGDAVGWGVATSPGWKDGRLVLTGRISIMGSMTDLRSTMQKTSE